MDENTGTGPNKPPSTPKVPSTIRYNPTPSSPPPGPALGFVAGAVAWTLFLVLQSSSDKNVALGAALFGFFGVGLLVPLIGLVLATRQTSKQFGVGLLLASGLGWMILLAICGGRR